MASRLRLPVVPVRLEGADQVLHRTWRWPKAGPVRVRFGAPLTLEGADYESLARRVEQAVRDLGTPPAIAVSRQASAARRRHRHRA
jgi:1-acyl-sn-glycerol-3-phosphate acyltransferase